MGVMLGVTLGLGDGMLDGSHVGCAYGEYSLSLDILHVGDDAALMLVLAVDGDGTLLVSLSSSARKARSFKS